GSLQRCSPIASAVSWPATRSAKRCAYSVLLTPPCRQVIRPYPSEMAPVQMWHPSPGARTTREPNAAIAASVGGSVESYGLDRLAAGRGRGRASIPGSGMSSNHRPEEGSGLLLTVGVRRGLIRRWRVTAVGIVDRVVGVGGVVLGGADRRPDLAGRQSGHLRQIGLRHTQVPKLDQRLAEG